MSELRVSPDVLDGVAATLRHLAADLTELRHLQAIGGGAGHPAVDAGVETFNAFTGSHAAHLQHDLDHLASKLATAAHVYAHTDHVASDASAVSTARLRADQ